MGELHDSVTQTLYSASFFAEVGRDLAEQGNLSQVKECLGRLAQISQQALKEMRLLVYQLRPDILKEEGLVPALRQRLELVENKVAIQSKLTVNQIRRLNNMRDRLQKEGGFLEIVSIKTCYQKSRGSKTNRTLKIYRITKARCSLRTMKM